MIRVELRKLVSRPRTWVSIGLLCLLPVVVAVFLSVTGIAPRPGQGPTLLAAVLGNGALYPAAALGIVLPFFLPIAVAVQAGEAVAGEASTGTLRYLLVRPVGRTRLLAAKLVSVVAYTLLAVVAVAVVGYVTGITLLGNSGQLTTTTLSGTALTPTPTSRGARASWCSRSAGRWSGSRRSRSSSRRSPTPRSARPSAGWPRS